MFIDEAGDSWDYNAAQSMILTDLTIDGRMRKVIMQAPKNGFFYVLDRLTGEFISGRPIVKVTWASGIDPQTGRPVETREAHYGVSGTVLSPSHAGAHHWPPMAWNPATGLVYIPAQETASFFAKEERFVYEPGRWNTGVWNGRGWKTPAGAVRARSSGFLVAWDPVAQRAWWRVDATPSGGLLSTAGNLVFAGEASGRFMALDATTGRVLWTRRLESGVATPISYEVDGRQYVSVLSGTLRGTMFTFALK